MKKSLKNQIVLVEMLLEALKELETFYIKNKDSYRYLKSPKKARVDRLRVEVQKELLKALKN